MLLGVAGAGVAYYFRYLATPTKVSEASPVPSPAQVVTESFASSTPAPSIFNTPELTASQDAEMTHALTPSPKAPRPASPLPSPVASPVVTRPTLDLTFGNPSATGEETVESGGSRTTYRSFTSVESAQFVALTSGNPQLKVCFQVMSNERVAGQSVAYVYVVDGTTAADTNLGSYGDLEPNRMYSLCRDTPLTVGTHSVTLELNKAHAIGESSFTNNLARFDYTVVNPE